MRLLPVAGVIPGISGYDWTSCWLQKRADLGLRASMSQPTMPAPLVNGGWSSHPLSSSEASLWLREIPTVDVRACERHCSAFCKGNYFVMDVKSKH